jgi:hypothetical protein
VRISEIARRRVDGTFPVDEWGFDPDMARVFGALTPVRWSIRAIGFEHVPEAGSALMVIGPRAKLSEPIIVGEATRQETGRHLRVAGADRVSITRGVARRMGAVPHDRREVHSVLRTGAIVGVLSARHRPGTHGPGPVDPALIAVALDLEVPVLPVAVRGHELGRRWTVTVGEPITHVGTGPLAAVDVTEQAGRTIVDLLG